MIIPVSTVVNLQGRLFLSSSSNCFRYISKCRLQYCGNFSSSAKQFYTITKGLLKWPPKSANQQLRLMIRSAYLDFSILWSALLNYPDLGFWFVFRFFELLSWNQSSKSFFISDVNLGLILEHLDFESLDSINFTCFLLRLIIISQPVRIFHDCFVS